MFGNIDNIIISELQNDGRKSLSEISKKIGISQVAVKKRLNKLQKNELLSISANLNLESFGARMALIIEVENHKIMKRIMKYNKVSPKSGSLDLLVFRLAI